MLAWIYLGSVWRVTAKGPRRQNQLPMTMRTRHLVSLLPNVLLRRTTRTDRQIVHTVYNARLRLREALLFMTPAPASNYCEKVIVHLVTASASCELRDPSASCGSQRWLYTHFPETQLLNGVVLPGTSSAAAAHSHSPI